MPPLPSDIKLRAAVDLKRRSDEWLGFKHVTAITKEDVKFGRGAVLHMSARDWWAEANGQQKSEKVTSGVKVMWIGKYKGKTAEWIEENDYGYHKWALENIKGYDKL